MVYSHKWSPISCRLSIVQGSSLVTDRRFTTVPHNQLRNNNNNEVFPVAFLVWLFAILAEVYNYCTSESDRTVFSQRKVFS